ncbi:MAG: hypothetical protein V4681_02365 [Patescibacteria group bacterium]
MNSSLADVTGIGLPFVKNSIPSQALQLGSVITYDFDGKRRLHMIICHDLGDGGWECSERYVRFGMDYLEHVDRIDTYGEGHRSYSIVRVGTGRVGSRDGADHIAINRAMADSFLIVDLYVWKREELMADVRAMRAPLKPYRAWSSSVGEVPLLLAA